MKNASMLLYSCYVKKLLKYGNFTESVENTSVYM
jgi:hypothetical protein